MTTTTLSSGVLLELLDYGTEETSAAKPVAGEHHRTARTAVLQVTEIVPAELDDKDLFPKHGEFHVKVSDASHSIYAALPLAQADLVLSDELRVGQLLHVDRLDPASPVPVVVGARPLPGLHPLVLGVPDAPAGAKPAALNFGTERMSTTVMDTVGAATRVGPRLTCSRSFVSDRDRHRQHPKEMSSVSCTTPRAMRRVASSPSVVDELGSPATSSSKSKKPSAAAARVPVVPGTMLMSLLGKDAMEQRDRARKAALDALRSASAANNVFRIYRSFSELSKSARPDAPAVCFDSFLSFHQEAVQAVTDIEEVLSSMAAAAVASNEHPEHAPPPVLQEIDQNRAVKRRRRGGGDASKSVSHKEDDGGGKTNWSSSATRKRLAMDKNGGEEGGDEKRACATSNAHYTLVFSLKLVKQIQDGAGSWFMEFLEAALETGLKKKKTKV